MSITPSGMPPGRDPHEEPTETREASYPTAPVPPPPPPPQYQQPAYSYPPPGYGPPPPPSARNWFAPIVLTALVVLAIANGFLFSELSATRKLLDQQALALKDRTSVLERRLDSGEQRVGSLSGELRQTRDRLGVTQRDIGRTREVTATLSEEQKQAAAQIGQVGQQVTSLREESGAKLGALSGEVTTAKTDIATTRKDLEQTRLQLTSAIGDISKSGVLIARNHDELTELKRRGERNYLEFDLAKEKQPRRIGDISVLLKKADPKRQRYTIELVVEDSRTEKKDKTVNEPVQFYLGRSRALYEIVVNRVGKDRVAGYLATPK